MTTPPPPGPGPHSNVEAPRDHLELRERMAPELPPRLLGHIDRVVELADELARLHGADDARTRMAAQGHDLLRAVPGPELLARAEARGWQLLDAERAAPVVLHGPLAAEELRERFGVTDPLVLDAIRWHTPGHPGLSTEGWAVFVADKIEPEKLKRWSALDEVAELAADSLEAAALRFLELRGERMRERGQTEHPQALATIEALRNRRDRGGP